MENDEKVADGAAPLHPADPARELNETEAAAPGASTSKQPDFTYHQLFESMLDAFVSFEISGRIREYNALYRELLGYSDDELRGLTHQDLTPQRWHAFEAKIVTDQILQRGYSDSYEKEYCRKDGTAVPVELSAVLIRDSAGRPISIWARVRDVSGRKHTEQSLQECVAVSRAVIASLRDGFAVLDRDGVHREVNPALCRITGFSKEELIGTAPPPPYWPPECDAEIDTAFRETLSGGGGEFARSFRRKNGERFPVLINPSAIRNEAGEIIGHLLSVKEVTDKKRAEDDLRLKALELEYYFSHAEDLFFIGDTEGYIHRLNPPWEKTLGYRLDELEGRRFFEFVHPDDMAATLLAVQNLAARQLVYTFTVRCRRKDGSYCLIEWNASSHRGKLILATARDVTARRQAEAELQRAAAVFANTHEGIAVTDAKRRFVAVNQAFTELTGYSKEEVLGKTPSMLKSERHDPGFYREMWTAIDSTGHWRGEIWNRRKTGEVYPELLTINAITDSTGEVTGYVGVFSDITRIKNYQEQLEILAHYDPLTGLINRRLLEARLEHALTTSQRTSETGALLLIDLDRFKEVNDAYGHPAGDELLQKVAQRFKHRLRQSDSLARLSGDEFAVMLEPPMTSQIAAYVAHQLLDALTKEITLDCGASIEIGASIGVGLFPEHGRTVSDLLLHTDAALYQAKRESRHTFRFFSEELTRKAREQLRMEERLRAALRNDELQVFYQAQLDVVTGRVIGAEALVRWHDPDEGLILPDRFIGLSEQTRLIVPLGDWVLKTACKQVDTWNRQGFSPEIRLAVNLSAFQVSRPDVASRILAILTETGFVPQALELELTETSLTNHRLDTVSLFVSLQHLGVTLALDDFGTGYSSLTNLERYPVRALKIDRRFITALPHDPAAAKITTAVIALAHILGFRAIAEGVETDAQLQFLAAEGCDACQGYLFSPPLPAEEFARRYLRAA